MSTLVPHNHVVNVSCLQEVLSSLISFPDNGELHHINTIESFVVLAWNFNKYTNCSSASSSNFSFVGTPKRIFEFIHPCPKGSISLPYFTLGMEESTIFRDEHNQIISESFMFPEASESSRLQAFYKSLELHDYNVNRCNSTKTTNHYCQFSGGGDIYISKKNVSVPLVFVSCTHEVLTERDEESSVVGDDAHGSPVTDGYSKLASLSIEVKKANHDSQKLKYQNINYGVTWLHWL